MERNFFLNKLSFAVFLWMAVTLYTGNISQSFKNFENKLNLSFLNLPTAYTNAKAMAVNALLPASPKAVIPKDDLQCMAENIYYEAGNQSYVGKLAVGQVVINRTRANGYPNTICGVIYDGSQNTKTSTCQFSWTCADRLNIDKGGSMWAQSMKAASELLFKQDTIVDITEGATNYHADYVKPPWAKTLRLVTKIDNHIFYKHS